MFQQVGRRVQLFGQVRHAEHAERRFQQLAPSAVAVSKQLMQAPGREELRQVITAEGELFGQRLRSPEAIEALSAFMQRRQPDFSKFL